MKIFRFSWKVDMRIFSIVSDWFVEKTLFLFRQAPFPPKRFSGFYISMGSYLQGMRMSYVQVRLKSLEKAPKS